jgi:hypothetical protein
MATVWLSKVLSASRRVSCFHSLVNGRGMPELPKVLSDLRETADDDAFSGVVHMSAGHGVKAFDAVDAAGGEFIALLRNPIEVTNSQLTEKINVPDHAMQWRKTVDFDWLKPEDTVFAWVATMALKHYYECSCIRDDLVFQFEDYTAKYGEIERMLAAITRGAINCDSDVENAFNTLGVINRHHKTKVTWVEVFFQCWTEERRRVYARIHFHLYMGLEQPELRAPRHYTFLHDVCAHVLENDEVFNAG